MTEEQQTSFEECLATLGELSPHVQTGFMEGKIMFRNGFIVETIWSHSPRVPDIFVLTGPGDVGFFGTGYQYGKTGDEALFAQLIAIPLPLLQ